MRNLKALLFLTLCSVSVLAKPGMTADELNELISELDQSVIAEKLYVDIKIDPKTKKITKSDNSGHTQSGLICTYEDATLENVTCRVKKHGDWMPQVYINTYGDHTITSKSASAICEALPGEWQGDRDVFYFPMTKEYKGFKCTKQSGAGYYNFSYSY